MIDFEKDIVLPIELAREAHLESVLKVQLTMRVNKLRSAKKAMRLAEMLQAGVVQIAPESIRQTYVGYGEAVLETTTGHFLYGFGRKRDHKTPEAGACVYRPDPDYGAPLRFGTKTHEIQIYTYAAEAAYVVYAEQLAEKGDKSWLNAEPEQEEVDAIKAELSKKLGITND